MKKFIAVLSLLTVGLFAYGFSNVGTTATSAVNNPYCGKTARDFPCPPAECPIGTVLDTDCYNECCEAYQSEMMIYYTNACSQYTVAIDAYDKAVTAAFDRYDTCVAAATNAAQRQACRTTCSASIQSAAGTLAAVKGGIDATLGSLTGNQLSIFDECVSHCCIP